MNKKNVLQNSYLNLLFLILLIKISFSQKLYTHYDYDQIFQSFEELSKTCSQYIKIDTSQSRYNLDSYKNCGKKPCMNLIVFLTDFESYTLDRPSYYISSAIHGDEVIGSSSLVEFAKYFCDSYNYKKNSLYHNILKTKLIIIPMTNAYGYYHKKREERVHISGKKDIDVDPNRDFPYFNSEKEIFNCMRTLSARTINEIFNEFIISGSITFHGGDNVLGYPWGNYLHIIKNKKSKQKSTESPDFNAFDNIGKIMVKFSSSKKNQNNSIPTYDIGDMTSTVYPLNGALEDWAYGGWEKYELNGKNVTNPIKTCKPDSFNTDYNMIWNSSNIYYNISYDYKLRCVIYLAEASLKKQPEEKYYGINDFDIKEDKRDVFDFYKTIDFFGHVPRNMRLVYTGVDLISSSIYLNVNNIKKYSDKNINNNIINYATIPFIFMGCLTLKKYSIYKIPFEHLTKELLTKDYFEQKLNSSTLFSEYNNTNNIKCYYLNNTYYNITIELPQNKSNTKKIRNLDNVDDALHHFIRPGGNYDYLGNNLGIKIINLYSKKGFMYIIRGEAPDENWGMQNNPDPNVLPQSHVVRSKIDKNYFVKNGNHSLKTNYYFYSYPIIAIDNEENNLKIVDDIDSFFYEDEFNIMKLLLNLDNKEFDVNSQIRFTKVNNKSVLTSENIYDVNIRVDIKLNQQNKINDEKKNKNQNINLFSSIIFPNDESNNNIYLTCYHNINSENNIFITCNILKEKTGSYIRQKLPNAIIGFDLKKDKKTFLHFFGTFSFDNDNKGKFFENNLMLCTNNFPYFINKEKNQKFFYNNDIYYKIDIVKLSNTKVKVEFDSNLNNKKYKNYVFLLYFPFSEEILFFNETKNHEKIIDINENADGKLLGKIIHIIPIEKSVYKKIQTSEIILKNTNNDLLDITFELSKIAKISDLYQSIPCSIMSYDSFSTSELKNQYKHFFSKFDVIIRNNNKRKKIIFIVSISISVILVLIITFIIIKIIKKKKATFNKFTEEPVQISNSSNS